MRITRIHLFNFRSVCDLTLNLDGDGLHALTGSFGSGKSSFLTGIRFCLFGDNGSAGKNTDLRRRGSDVSEDAGCEVEFIHENDTYVARRWLRHSDTAKGVKETAQASLLRNGDPIDGITASTLTREITTITGLTAKAYTSANLIPQGEVAELMAASPTEVQKLIEEHTGLAALTSVRDDVRKTANNAAAAAAALPGSQEDADVAASEQADAQSDLDAAMARLDASTAQQRQVEAVAKEKQKAAWTLHKQAESAARCAADIARAEAVVELKQQQVSELTLQAQRSGADTLADANRQAEEIDAQVEELTEAGIAIKTAAEAVHRAEQALTAAQHTAATAQQQAHQLQADHPDLDTEFTNYAAQATEADNRSRHHAAQSYSFTQEATRLDKAIATLGSHNTDDHTCPTCGQHVADHAELVATLTTSRDLALSRAQDATGQAETANRQAQQCRTRMEDTRALRTTITAAQRRHSDALATAETADQEADTASAHLADTIAQMVNLCVAEGYSSADAEPDTVLDTGRQLVTVLRRRRSAISEAISAHQRLTAAGKELTAATDALTTTHATTITAPARSDIDQADHSADQARAVADEATVQRNQRAEEAAEARAAHSVVAAHAEHKAAEWDAKKAALEEAAVARGEADALRALRADLLAEYTDAICRSASDLLGRFGGEYVAFHLGSDFVPRAELADGTLVRTAILSGGESALVGLAFRVAVTLVITGGGLPEQMLCDEVTNYLDEAGRRAVLSALTTLFPSVLLISHTAEAEDYATAMHRVERGELEPTRWVA